MQRQRCQCNSCSRHHFMPGNQHVAASRSSSCQPRSSRCQSAKCLTARLQALPSCSCLALVAMCSEACTDKKCCSCLWSTATVQPHLTQIKLATTVTTSHHQTLLQCTTRRSRTAPGYAAACTAARPLCMKTCRNTPHTPPPAATRHSVPQHATVRYCSSQVRCLSSLPNRQPQANRAQNTHTRAAP